MPRTIRYLITGLLLALASGAAWAVTTTSVIVELQGDPGAVWRARQIQQGGTVSDSALAAYRAQLTTAQNQVLTRIAAAGIPATIATVSVPGASGAPTTVQRRYTLVYNGFTLTVAPADVARLRGVSGVKDVHRVRLYTLALDRSVPFIRAPELYGGVPELGPLDDVREGYEGQGIVMSVIDSGIEWQHEMFGGDVTPPRLGLAPASPLVPANKKVVYNLPLMDWVVEDGIGHGTHVATTAAGYLGFEPGGDGVPLTADDVRVHGVAPQARLMSYKVCSDTLFAANVAGSVLGVGLIGECLGDIVLALEDSVSPRTLTGFTKPVAQVINMSLGSTFGQPDDPTAAAASNAALMGAIVVAAAGNSGDVPGIVGSPSVGTHVISIGNATDPGSAANWFVDAGDRTDIVTFPMAGTPSPPAAGLSDQFCFVQNSLTAADYPAGVAGRIALIENGAVVGLFAEFANNAALAGATAALLIGDTENATAVKAPIPAAVIKPADAAYLLSLIGPNPQHGDVSPGTITLKGAVGQFLTAMNGSSSRGPVIGLGQVKPDLSAPGTNILAGVPPASVIGAITTEDGLTYGTISGTSMASPHAAGAAAQIKQANPTWTPDMVRTAMINNATPMRDAAGVPDSFGSQNPKIHAQGGGYIDVARTARAKALMGVVGDGIATPGILGSHSFGASPVINNQCTNSLSVQVTIRDLRGTGGTYNLTVHDNRELSRAGISATVSPASVSVPAGGAATFTASISFDGAQITADPQVDVQWFVVADRADGSERLSMPFFYRAVPSAPAGSGGGSRVETEVREGTLGLGSSAVGVGEQSVDVAVEVAAGTFRLAGLLESDEVTNAGYPDIDLELYDPNGNMIDNSGVPGGVESVDVGITQPGTYVFRVINYANAGGSFTLTVDKHMGADAGAATLAAIATEYTEQDGDRVDFDGSFTLSWSGVGGETAYRVERSVDGGAWEQIARVTGTSLALSDLADGTYAFRVRSEFPGALCTYIEQPGNTQTVRVDHRTAFLAENVDVVLTEAWLQNGVFEALVVLTNNSDTTLLNPVTLEIIGIDSETGDVRVINADNNGGGTSSADVAIFSYAGPVLGEELSPGETSWARTIRFADPSNVLFSFEAQVRAYRRP